MKTLAQLIGETSGLISEIKAHPDYQSLVNKGYQPEITLGDAYAMLGNLMWEIAPSLISGGR
ncbi:hypothetical protein [Nostoc sp.]|uniref:hypothetical protein n=1 Tax=Nostoc sp. TaxID=1180 RepID=UPI002FF994A5